MNFEKFFIDTDPDIKTSFNANGSLSGALIRYGGIKRARGEGIYGKRGEEELYKLFNLTNVSRVYRCDVPHHLDT